MKIFGFLAAVLWVFTMLSKPIEVSAQMTIQAKEYNSDQHLLIDMMHLAPDYFELTFDQTPQTIQVNLEQLQPDGEWEAEALFTHELSEAEVLMMIDLHPLAFSFQEMNAEAAMRFFNIDSMLYPDETASGKLRMDAHWTLDKEYPNLDKRVIGYPILLDVSIINDDVSFLKDFDYNDPSTDFPSHITEIYALTIEIIEE